MPRTRQAPSKDGFRNRIPPVRSLQALALGLALAALVVGATQGTRPAATRHETDAPAGASVADRATAEAAAVDRPQLGSIVAP